MAKQISISELFVFIVTLLTVQCKDENGHVFEEKRQRSGLNTNGADLWPLPRAGEHHNNVQYPFMIVAPPDATDNKEELKDSQGSKYYTNKRQSVNYPQATPLSGYVPVYYLVPQYPATNQAFYTNYLPYQDNTVLDSQYLQFSPNYETLQPSYATSPYIFLKRSNARKIGHHQRSKPSRRQIVPRHHWAFSQWPFDSHEYAFTKHPYLSHMRNPPRWGPMHWGGVGPKKHWGMNREGLPSPFGIGLAPHMGGQGYIGLDGHWPGGHGYPMATNFPKSPLLQHHLP